ncbi:malectin domain-containing carbohydrate-binding protein [Hymenobacter citatus]|uniref:malectin domain-containing carbohydrate-binding protein n=1 Tax=Hymenobacter citatus TaxID=2763506 RepID=UPI001FE51A9E|nr:malectin domain-containing carbohydrate-binding protein [Hymenobacter citatus]
MPIRDIAVTDTAAYYVTGFNEGQNNLHRFSHRNTRTQYNVGRVDGFTALTLLDTDGTNLYIANNEGGVYTGGRASFIYARRISDNAEVRFAAGQEVRLNNNYPDQYYTSVLDLDQTSTALSTTGITVLSNAATGLAVQKKGQLLAVAHRNQHIIRLFDKTSGQLLRTINTASPGSLSMTPNGDLWAISGTSVVRYTNLSSNPTVAATITGLSKPLALATDPTNEDIVLVADGGSSQQVKAFSAAGGSLWTYGQAGGYPANGSDVRNDKLWFHHSVLGETTFVTILPDHSFWVGDIANSRCLHISAARTYQEQIMYQPHSYATSVDANNPTRVFNEFLEFKVDYSKPLGESWTLVKNWRAGLSTDYVGFFQGVRQVATLSNGRTYALLRNISQDYMEVAELAGTKLRPTGIKPARTTDEAASLMADGSLNLAPFNPRPGTTVTWYTRPLSGFDAANNPQWGTPIALASTPVGTTDPVSRTGGIGDIATPITSSKVVVSLDYSKNNGWHLGGLLQGSNKWLWKASPTGPLNGKGNYDIGNGVQYGGNTVLSTDRHILYGYHGEFWNNAQAGQFMHFYDNGLFVGQFGETTKNHDAREGVIAGSAGNAVSPDLASVNGETYLWVNDEGGHGPQRWHLVGTGTVQEAKGTGSLGGTIVVAAPTATFPQQLTAVPGESTLQLSWQPVPNATSYTVSYSTTPGGPYSTVTRIGSTGYTLPNLTNGIPYYVSVAAQLAAGAGPASAEVMATPLAPNASVQAVGHQASNSTEFVVDPSAPSKNSSSLQLQAPLRYVSEPLALTKVGRKGYVLFNWNSDGSDNTNVLAPFKVSKGSGWRVDTYLKFKFQVNGTSGKDAGLYSNPAGKITIDVTDDNWHYATVFCPARFDDARNFSISLAPVSQNGPAARYTVQETMGQNHVFQFRFKGAVALTVDNGQTGAVGIVQAIFLDSDTVAAAVPTPVAAPVVAPAPPQVASFTLVNADNSQDIRTLTSGETLDLATLPTKNLAIRANTGSSTVGSVALKLTGTLSKETVDNTSLYTLFGDDNGRYTPWVPQVGTYSLTATAYSAGQAGGTASAPLAINFSVVNKVAAPAVVPAAQQVVSFTLVNADNSQDIKTFVNGETINLSTLPTKNLAIRANTNPVTVGSVVIKMSGTLSKQVTENIPFYTLFGDNNGRYTPWVPQVGTYSLTATAYSAGQAGGTASAPFAISFTFANTAARPAESITAISTPTISTGSVIHRINAGGKQVSTDRGVFAADKYYVPAPGNTAAVTGNIAGTINDALYQTERYGTNGTFRYALPVTNGQYTVVLHFAETFWSEAGRRVFDVTLEGNKVLDNYDIYRKVGRYTMKTETFTTTVKDGSLNIDFSALKSDGGSDQPQVCAIEVLSTSTTLAATASTQYAVAAEPTSAAAPVLTAITLSAYPNPTPDGQVTITLPEPQTGEVWYTLFSATGSAVSGGKASLGAFGSELKLDLGRGMKQPGTYYLWLQSKTWQSRFKIVRQ